MHILSTRCPACRHDLAMLDNAQVLQHVTCEHCHVVVEVVRLTEAVYEVRRYREQSNRIDEGDYERAYLVFNQGRSKQIAPIPDEVSAPQRRSQPHAARPATRAGAASAVAQAAWSAVMSFPASFCPRPLHRWQFQDSVTTMLPDAYGFVTVVETRACLRCPAGLAMTQLYHTARRVFAEQNAYLFWVTLPSLKGLGFLGRP